LILHSGIFFSYAPQSLIDAVDFINFAIFPLPEVPELETVQPEAESERDVSNRKRLSPSNSPQNLDNEWDLLVWDETFGVIPKALSERWKGAKDEASENKKCNNSPLNIKRVTTNINAKNEQHKSLKGKALKNTRKISKVRKLSNDDFKENELDISIEKEPIRGSPQPKSPIPPVRYSSRPESFG
jgi:hypothetical protein